MQKLQATEGQPLDYAPPQRWGRRRIIVLAALAILLAGGVGWWRWGAAAWERAELLYWQWRCMTYRAPAEQVVFTQDPELGLKLLEFGPQYRAGYPLVRLEDETRRQPDMTQPPEAVWLKPAPWVNFPAGKWEPGPAFLHARRSTSGTKRLVALELSHHTSRNSWPKSHPRRPTLLLSFYCRSLTPASLLSDGNLSRRNGTMAGIYHIRTVGDEYVTLYAGQPTRTDPAAFTIRCEIAGRAGTIDGRLEDDGTITLTPRDAWLLEYWAEGRGGW